MTNFKMCAIPTASSLLLSYKLEPGISDQSYGLFIARMAGIPQEIIERSESMLTKMRQGEGRVGELLRKIDINRMTPIQALMCLNDLKKVVDEQSEGKREALLEEFYVKYGMKWCVCCAQFQFRYSLKRMSPRLCVLVLLFSIYGSFAWFSTFSLEWSHIIDIEHITIAQIAQNHANSLSFVSVCFVRSYARTRRLKLSS